MAIDEGDKLSASSHYTNEGRLYDSTLPLKNSYDTHRMRDSVKSASFLTATKLEHGSFGGNNDGSGTRYPDSPMRP
jgi:hypothetical protein